MGVPAFFRWLARRFPHTIREVADVKKELKDAAAKENKEAGESKEAGGQGAEENIGSGGFDHLYLDMNGIIHPCCHPEKNPPKSEDEMIERIFDYLDGIVELVAPRKLLFLAIDGVAPRAKMNQQRSRRFRSAFEHKRSKTPRLSSFHIKKLPASPPPIDSDDEEEAAADEEEAVSSAPASKEAASAAPAPEEIVSLAPAPDADASDVDMESSPGGQTDSGKGEKAGAGEPDEVDSPAHWDSNVITPGTPFMEKVAEALRYYVRERLKKHALFKDIVVIFSDASVPGEGEHKIMDFLRRNRLGANYNANTRHVLYGLDADLIMLGLASHEPHFWILRERQPGVVPRWARKKSLTESSGPKRPCPFELVAIPELREYIGQYFAYMRCNPNAFEPTTAAASSAAKTVVSLHTPSARKADDTLPFAWSLERLIDDFVFLCFFVGNDFLPHLPALDIRFGAIDKLMKLYARMLPALGGYLCEGGDVNLTRLDVLLSEISAFESVALAKMAEKAAQRHKRPAKRKRGEQQTGGGGGGATAASSSEWVATAGVQAGLPAKRPKVDPSSSPNPAAASPTTGEGMVTCPNTGVSAPSAQALKRLKKKIRDKARKKRKRLEKAEKKRQAEKEGGAAAAEAPVTSEGDAPPAKRQKAESAAARADTEAVPSEGANAPADSTNAMSDDLPAENSPQDAATESSSPLTASQSSPDAIAEQLKAVKGKRKKKALKKRLLAEAAAAAGLPPPVAKGPRRSASAKSVSAPPASSARPPQPRLQNTGKQSKKGVTLFDSTKSVRFGTDGFAERYYERNFAVKEGTAAATTDVDAEKQRIFVEYVRGLRWVMKYYYDGCPSWNWYYPFHYAPFAADLLNLDTLTGVGDAFESSTPFSPVAQLMAVLPKASAHCVPDAVRPLMCSNKSPIADFYPTKFHIDLNGNRQLWRGVALLPFIDEKRLLGALDDVSTQFSDVERSRDVSRAYSDLYVHSANPLAAALRSAVDRTGAENEADDGFSTPSLTGTVRTLSSPAFPAGAHVVKAPCKRFKDLALDAGEVLTFAYDFPKKKRHLCALLPSVTPPLCNVKYMPPPPPSNPPPSQKPPMPATSSNSSSSRGGTAKPPAAAGGSRKPPPRSQRKNSGKANTHLNRLMKAKTHQKSSGAKSKSAVASFGDALSQLSGAAGDAQKSAGKTQSSDSKPINPFAVLDFGAS